jgi:GTP-binding protein EngB required for normal cell division
MAGEASPTISAASASEPPLEPLARVADALGELALAREARAAAERLSQGLAYVALLGQFKRGKSSLLNALIGRALLPVGVTPVTSVVTVVRYGPSVAARARDESGRWQEIAPERLGDYVSEEGNPGNRRQVAIVEVFAPSPLLANGMCLVDTPGVGSVIAANTESTLAFVPHIDAAIAVLGVDPPISSEELDLVEQAARAPTRLVVVLNKADRFGDREREEAIRFTRRVLARRLGGDPPPIHEVSALDILSGNAPSAGWLDLRRELERLSAAAESRLAREAERRETSRIVQRLLRRVAEHEAALSRPIEETEARIAALAASVRAGELALGDLGYLLRSESDRLSADLRTRREAFLADEVPEAREELLHALPSLAGTNRRKNAYDTARRIAREHLEGWAAREEPASESRYREAMRRFDELAEEFLERFLGQVGPEAQRLSTVPRSTPGLRVRSRRFYTEVLEGTSPKLFDFVFDAISPPPRSRLRISRDAAHVLERLLDTNSARVQNDLIDRVEESRRLLEIDVRSRLREALEAAHALLSRARRLRQEGAERLTAESRHLAQLRETVLAAQAEVPG